VNAYWLAAALAAVAFATQPLALELYPFKRAVLLAVGAVTLLLPAGQAALQRALSGARRLWALWLACVALAAAIAIGQTGYTPQAVLIGRELLCATLFVVVAATAREGSWNFGPRLAGALVAVGAAAAAVALAQPAGFDLVYGSASQRAAVGTFGNTNACAAFLAPLLPLAAAHVRAHGKAAGRGRLAWLAGALLAGALLVARARGGWIAALAGLATTLWLLQRDGRPILAALLAVVVGLALGGAAQLSGREAPELAAKPLGLGLERSSNQIRLDVMRGTLALARAHPLVGVGPGRFRSEYPPFRVEREAKIPTRGGFASEVDHPHCEPLRQLAEGGILALLAFGLALLATLRAALASRRAARDDDGRLSAGWTGALVAWIVSGLTWSTLHDPASLLLGAILVGASLAGEPEPERIVPRKLLCLPMTALLAGASLFLAQATLRAEWVEWRAGRDGVLDAADLDDLRAAAASDSFDFEREYAIAIQLLDAARQDPAGGELFLARAETCLKRGLEIVPNHVASRVLLAEVFARRGEDAAARVELARVHRLEPWRGPLEPAFAALLAAIGREFQAARARLEKEGDAAVAPLRAQAAELTKSGRAQPAAQILDLLSVRDPDDGDLARELSLVLKSLDDSAGFGLAQRRAQLAYAVAALAAGKSEEARGNLDVARRYAPAPAALEELLEACVDLQRARIDAARQRLEALDPAAGHDAWQKSTPAQRRVLRFLTLSTPLAEAVVRFGPIPK
jgi:O-antigen ligase